MGKPKPKLQEADKNPAPVTPESTDVKGAQQRKHEELSKRNDRRSTYLTNPAMRTGFAALANKKTGSV